VQASDVFIRPSQSTGSDGLSGWHFARGNEEEPDKNVVPDPIHANAEHISDVYLSSDPDYAGRFSVPLLWDKKTETAVSNESSEIIRMLYTEFDDLLPEKYRTPNVDLYPTELKAKIDETNVWTYDHINNGVYNCGMAITQEAYEKAVTELFKHLDRVEEHLASSPGPYYFGENITEADIRLYPTIIRFDPVYVRIFPRIEHWPHANILPESTFQV
jgi:putative glutathione S-transferase